MKHLLYLLLCLMLLSSGLNAQSISRSVISTAGESSQGKSITLDWTLGEMATSTLTHDAGLLTEGFQQPDIKVEAIAPAELPIPVKGEVETVNLEALEINAYPNPVSQSLWVETNSNLSENGILQLVDARGSIHLQQQLSLDQSKSELNMAPLASGSYYLIVRNEEGAILKTLKVTKIH